MDGRGWHSATFKGSTPLEGGTWDVHKYPRGSMYGIFIYLVSGSLTVTVTTRIITFLVGDSYKPLFATVTGRGPHPIYTYICLIFYGKCREIYHTWMLWVLMI